MQEPNLDHQKSQEDQTASAVAEFMSARDLFARHLGIEIMEVRPGYSRAALSLVPYMRNGLGMIHGAAIFALADFAFATACNSYGMASVALSMDIHFLSSPNPDSRLEAEAIEVRSSRRTGLYRITVTDGDSLVAECHGMAYRKDTRFLDDIQT